MCLRYLIHCLKGKENENRKSTEYTDQIAATGAA